MTTRKIGGALVALALLGWSVSATGQDAPVAKPTNTMKRAIQWKRFDYTCENDRKVVVFLHDTTAKVRFEDQVYLMKQTPSADGNRYSDGKVLWWGKGDGGVLQEDNPDGDGKTLVKDCVADKAAAAAPASSITGTITYLVRMALPPQSTIQVQLQDVSKADASATVIAQERFQLGQKQVPVPFTLKYDPAKIDAQRRYAVTARVMFGTELKFATDQAYLVITQGNPSKVDLILKPPKP